MRGQVKKTSQELSVRRAERGRPDREVKMKQAGEIDRTGVLVIASELKEGIAKADHTTRRYALEQLDLQCQVNQCGNDYNATVTCGFSEMTEQKK